MIRAVAIIAAAILICQPYLPKPQAEQYARALHRSATRNRVPALLLVAIAENETHWSRSLVSKNGEYVGLGMVRLRNYAACRTDLTTPECQAVKAMLLDGSSNLAVMGKTLRMNIDFCKKRGKAGRQPLAVGLGGYQGNGCHVTRLTRKVLRRWHQLEAQARRRLRRRG